MAKNWIMAAVLVAVLSVAALGGTVLAQRGSTVSGDDVIRESRRRSRSSPTDG